VPSFLAGDDTKTWEIVLHPMKKSFKIKVHYAVVSAAESKEIDSHG